MRKDCFKKSAQWLTGTGSRDFRPSVLFPINLPWVTDYHPNNMFEFGFNFAEIFAHV
jgi:hypothetical protein